MNLDPASRAAIAWRVVAAVGNATGDVLPEWNDVTPEVKGFVIRAVESDDAAGSGLAAALTEAGWTMGRWNPDERLCVLSETTLGPGLVGWAAANAALASLKEL